MKKLTKSFSHVNLKLKAKKSKKPDWFKPADLDQTLKSEPMKIQTYDALVQSVEQILHRNRELTIYYRGQHKDYKDKYGRSTILPSIYRKRTGENTLMLKDRFENLREKVNALRQLFRESKIRYAGTLLLNKYPEISWSLLQHYEICDTPLLDLTHSLHVACSFAFDQNKNETGIVYVFGLPWQSDAIGYNTFEELVNLRLLNVVPPNAQRPFFQEGYLAGPFPNYQLDNPKRVRQFDFQRRLIAKFEIPINDSRFWGVGFGKIPRNKLYQPKDNIKSLCDNLK